MAARKNPEVVEDAASASETSVETVEPTTPETLAPALDPELDQVPDQDYEPGHSDRADDADDAAADQSTTSPKRGKLVIGAVGALVVAVVAVIAAGSLGGDDPVGLPDTVTDPVVVLNALEAGGVSCTGTAVSGDVATCNATVAVRVFDSSGDAESYVSGLLKDPLTSSAIGWVRHGNVVVAGPLIRTPALAEALGPDSQIY